MTRYDGSKHIMQTSSITIYLLTQTVVGYHGRDEILMGAGFLSFSLDEFG